MSKPQESPKIIQRVVLVWSLSHLKHWSTRLLAVVVAILYCYVTVFLCICAQAMSYQQRAVLMTERVLGVDHPNTITEYVSHVPILWRKCTHLQDTCILCMCWCDWFVYIYVHVLVCVCMWRVCVCVCVQLLCMYLQILVCMVYGCKCVIVNLNCKIYGSFQEKFWQAQPLLHPVIPCVTRFYSTWPCMSSLVQQSSH